MLVSRARLPSIEFIIDYHTALIAQQQQQQQQQSQRQPSEPQNPSGESASMSSQVRPNTERKSTCCEFLTTKTGRWHPGI